jgi:thiosulfate dehydrogenase
VPTFYLGLRWMIARVRSCRPVATAICVGVLAVTGCSIPSPVKTVDIHVPSRDADADTVEASVVPPDSAMPTGALGKSMRRGRALLQHTHDSLPRYAPANLRCISCHLDDGRRVDGAPLVGAYARYPRYVERAGAVVSIEERINYCFTRSLAGRRLPPSSREMQDIVSYLAFLSTGVPTGAHVRGEGLPRVPKLTGDSVRGQKLFVANCVRCHGAGGGGGAVPVNSRGQNSPLFAPALWGARSFSIGAGLARIERAAAFIRSVMPYDRPGTVSDQEAYDLAAFLLSHPRPDLPAKASDWPAGGAPADVPYSTRGHVGYRPPVLIRRSGDTGEMIAAPPAPAPR